MRFLLLLFESGHGFPMIPNANRIIKIIINFKHLTSIIEKLIACRNA